jgi:HSP20 family protein
VIAQMFDAPRTDPFGVGMTHGAATWQPAADVHRCAEGWIVKIELAGVRPEDIHIRPDAGGILISGCRRDVRHFQSTATYRMEISYSKFERLVPLPEPIENLRFQMEYRDGMLFVRIGTRENE